MNVHFGLVNLNILRSIALALLALLPARAQITAAVAANVQYAMEDLRADFKKSSGVDVKAIYGSSGKLAAQVKNGAPFDVFVSADMDFPDSLFKWGYAAEKPKPYAFGKLVLWTIKGLDLGKGLAGLADADVGKIAVADSQRAPYGREAVKALRKAGVYDAARSKLVFGESISQVNQYVLLGTADIGFTAKSVVLAGEMKGKGVWKEVDSSAYEPIAQGAVICKYGMENNPGLSKRFADYLHSRSARDIFARYGYQLP